MSYIHLHLPERRGGELLMEMNLHQGGRPEKTPTTMGGVNSPTLSDMDLNYNQSSRWQAIAQLPEEVFEGYLAEKIEADVFSWNFYRKHYTVGQKAMILAKRSVLEKGSNQYGDKVEASGEASSFTIPELAEEGGVSRGAVGHRQNTSPTKRQPQPITWRCGPVAPSIPT
jgi:hypothetical protein